MDEPDQIRTLIEYMGKNLADEPEAVTVVLVSREDGLIYRLLVAPNDVEKIIGKHRHTVRSMRIILSAIGTKLQRKVSLEISE
jgi:hypothetical protein